MQIKFVCTILTGAAMMALVCLTSAAPAERDCSTIDVNNQLNDCIQCCRDKGFLASDFVTYFKLCACSNKPVKTRDFEIFRRNGSA